MRTSRHSRVTRLIHLAIALAVVVQLTTSRVMDEPHDDRPGDILFEIHEYSGLTAFTLMAIFWLVIAFRRRGSAPGLLFPWFSRARLGALRDDAMAHARGLPKGRLPVPDGDAALPSAVHGLGILLITAMATTGLIYFVALGSGATDSVWAEAAEETHEILANLVWAYLIGHVGMALINHFSGRYSLGEMWSLRRGTRADPESG